MSLREDYSGTCTGGFHDDMGTVFQAGVDFIGTAGSPGIAYPTLSTGLNTAATQGSTEFTISVDTSFEPDNLRLDGIHQQTYFAGILQALAAEGIYSMYVTLTLNTSLTTSTGVDFKFSL
jgi:hypothetical protein